MQLLSMLWVCVRAGGHNRVHTGCVLALSFVMPALDVTFPCGGLVTRDLRRTDMAAFSSRDLAVPIISHFQVLGNWINMPNARMPPYVMNMAQGLFPTRKWSLCGS